MSGSDKHRLNPTLIGAISIAIITVILYSGMSYSAGYQSGWNDRKAQIEATHYASDAPNRIERECAGFTGKAARECVAQIVDAQRENERGESDLAAQWKAADWVMLGGIVAGIQLLASIIGLYYIKGTLDETAKAVAETGAATVAMRQANQLAEEMSKRQLRAYICKEQVWATVYTHDDYTLEHVKLAVLIQNRGQSPAIIEYPMVDAHLIGPDDPIPPIRTDWPEITILNRHLGPGSQTFLDPQFLSRSGMDLVGNRQKRLILNVWIAYRDIFGDRWETAGSIEVIPVKDPTKHEELCKARGIKQPWDGMAKEMFVYPDINGTGRHS
ncbi:hypothetical protein BWQ93_12625 [Sphingopyxis sp. QXT-31]|uniref:hypothetical protein n=1 Tax=Sphingopyxis sp. QXT-31 TaxID=1357916 RepID=UPI0009791AF2|nr:hypothetical protein [Sphingopyxis sp. QXT-31]APZ99240.1 hypothetical protein BWQ93_12625 [Sphingopyxis sp. QXT-31]